MTLSLGIPSNFDARGVGVDTHYRGEVKTASGIIVPPPGPTVSPYEQLILSRNPLSFWRQGELSGPVGIDLGSVGNDIIYVENPQFGISGAIANDTNTAIGYGVGKGLGKISDVGYGAALGTEFSLELWLKRSVAENSDVVFSQWDGVASSEDFALLFNTSGSPTLFWLWATNTGAIISSVNTGLTLADNNWHHVVAYYNNGGGGIYIDGVFIGVVGTNSIINNSAIDLSIASYTNIGNASGIDTFPGELDEIAIYGFELTAQEVLENYNKGIGI